ncbi:MAG TPA: hypothetical protein VEI97_20885, partial [bacterium]|nr:hypothetical protein [bacterium]
MVFLSRVTWPAFLLALLLGSALRPLPTFATHAVGADMAYLNTAPGIYVVTYRFYRDCSGLPADTTSLTLSYSATGCGPTGTATNGGGTTQLLKLNYVDGNPYCSRILQSQQPCDPTSAVPSGAYPNYQIWTYSGLLTLGS